jgi:hypothetical protein
MKSQRPFVDFGFLFLSSYVNLNLSVIARQITNYLEEKHGKESL